MKQGNLYPVGEGLGSLGINWGFPVLRFQVESTGEFRPPKKNEWYISGATPEGYKAPNNLTTAFHIGRLVEIKTETIIKKTKLRYLS